MVWQSVQLLLQVAAWRQYCSLFGFLFPSYHRYVFSAAAHVLHGSCFARVVATMYSAKSTHFISLF